MGVKQKCSAPDIAVVKNTLQLFFSSRIFEANFISELLEVVLSAEYEIQMRISILYPKF